MAYTRALLEPFLWAEKAMYMPFWCIAGMYGKAASIYGAKLVVLRYDSFLSNDIYNNNIDLDEQ